MNFKSGLFNIFYFSQNIKFLANFCINYKINIIHTHHRYTELLSAIVARKLNIKTITTVHSFTGGFKNLSYKSDRILTVSESVKKHLDTYYQIPEYKITNLHNPFPYLKIADEVSRIQIEKKLNIESNDRVMLFIGRISLVKGVDILFQAFEELVKDFSNLKLIILGSITDRRIKKQLQSLSDNVKVLPATNSIQDFYSISDIIILPSREDPFPYVMLEAGIFSKPLIGSNTGGIGEYIEHNKNGLLFEVGNINQLKESIKYLLNNPQKAKELGENLHNKVIKENKPEKYFGKLDKIYKDLLNERNL